MKTGRIIVDGDPIVYRAAFAAQTTVYEVMYERYGELRHRVYEGDPRESIKLCQADGWEISERWHTVWPGDRRLLEMAIDSQMKGIFRHCTETLGVTSSMEVILSGTGNYRNEIATIAGYKANRRKLEKPWHYAGAKEYVHKTWNAYVVDGREADDEVSIRMRRATAEGTPAILATIDKDLDQIPGLHYDYSKHVSYDVTAQEGMQLFYAQILCGDTTDNIPGCVGLGEKKSKALIALAVEEITDQDETLPLELIEGYLWECVVTQYRERGVKGYEPGERTWEDVALEVARLVKLQEYPGQLWSPPGVADEIVEGNADD